MVGGPIGVIMVNVKARSVIREAKCTSTEPAPTRPQAARGRVAREKVGKGRGAE